MKMDYALCVSFTIILISFIVGIIFFQDMDDYYSYSESYFSTKTPYRYSEFRDTSPISAPGCTPVKIWMLIRHGTRTSKKHYQVSMKNLFIMRHIILEQLKREDTSGNGEESIFNYIPFSSVNLNRRKLIIAALDQWNPNSYVNDGLKTLTSVGAEEMFNMAQRYAIRFSDILSAPYSNKTYLFRHTNTQRTKASAQFFAEGLFGEEAWNSVQYPEPLSIDPVLRFYKTCPKWRNSVKKSLQSKFECSQFKSGMIMDDMIHDLSKTLGYKHNLPFDDVYLMYMTCCYEMAWLKNGDSPWCKVFTRDDLEVMEYFEDLQYYWIDGYGYKINHEIACVTFKDAFNHLMSDGNLTSVFYFTHSGTLLKFLAHLGLYRDNVELRYDNYQQMTDRQWKTSKIDTFGTNIVFVTYKCGNELKILTMHQERPVILPGCPFNTYLCPANLIKDIFNKSLTYCNLDAMCTFEENIF